MNRILLGVLVGIVFGILDVLLMIPISFPSTADKRVAMICKPAFLTTVCKETTLKTYLSVGIN